MIQWGDLLRVPYTGYTCGVLGYLSCTELVYTFVLSSFMFTLLKPYIYISVYVLFSFVGALLQGSVKLLSGSAQDPL